MLSKAEKNQTFVPQGIALIIRDFLASKLNFKLISGRRLLFHIRKTFHHYLLSLLLSFSSILSCTRNSLYTMENTLLYNFYISGLPENFQTYRNFKKIFQLFLSVSQNYSLCILIVLQACSEESRQNS